MSELSILVIENNPLILQHLYNALSKYYQVTTAEEQSDALRLLCSQQIFGCVIVDGARPEVDGIELLQRMRRTKRYAETPVVILTEFNTPQLSHTILTEQNVSFLTKPFSSSAPQMLIQGILNNECPRKEHHVRCPICNFFSKTEPCLQHQYGLHNGLYKMKK